MAEAAPKQTKGPFNPNLNMNPNPGITDGPNDAPDGPHSHLMGQTGDGGLSGKETASGKNGETFYFK